MLLLALLFDLSGFRVPAGSLSSRQHNSPGHNSAREPPRHDKLKSVHDFHFRKVSRLKSFLYSYTDSSLERACADGLETDFGKICLQLGYSVLILSKELFLSLPSHLDWVWGQHLSDLSMLADTFLGIKMAGASSLSFTPNWSKF